MGILLFLLGLLAAGSGAGKLRERTRARLGFSWLAVAEVLLGSAVVLGSGIGLSRMRPAAWSAVGATLVVMMLSTLFHLRRAARHRRDRASTEDDRLKLYLETRRFADPPAKDPGLR